MGHFVLAFSACLCYFISMIKNKTHFKKGDVLLSRDNKVFQFIQAVEHEELGMIAMVRPYRTNRKVGIRFQDVKLHPLFA
tara:strand:- start:345 stop:584 length:240 start_codon:yes stop_codon:yes gene_type:complete